jgi:hypothetical protein
MSLNKSKINKQDWKGILFGVHYNSKGALYAMAAA